MGVRNPPTGFARLDGDTGERDRLCRFHRHRDLWFIRQKNERQALVETRLRTTPLTAEYVGRAALAYALGNTKNKNPQ